MHADHSRIPQNLLPWVDVSRFSREKQEETLPWWLICIDDSNPVLLVSTGCFQQCSHRGLTSVQSKLQVEKRFRITVEKELAYKIKNPNKIVYLENKLLSKFVSKFGRASNEMQNSSHDPRAWCFSGMYSCGQHNYAFIL